MKKRQTRFSVGAVDLFCGAGGLTHGLSTEGIPVLAGFDSDADCKFAYEHNNNAKFVEQDVGKLSAYALVRALQGKKYKVLAGCAPCQAFSTYTQSAGSRRKRWGLVRRFGELAIKVKPDVLTMENVPELVRHRQFRDIVSSLKRAGYHVSYDVVQCAEYGAPQSRRRLVLLASRLGPISLLTPAEFGSEPRTVRDAIGTLPAVQEGQVHPRDRIHRASKLSTLNLKRIRASRPGGTWRDWPRALRTDCHKRSTGSGYPSIYGRLVWNNIAPTMTTLAYNLGSGRFGHPEQDRALTLREIASLQTFPKDYRFWSPRRPVNVRAVGRLIGNAVPVVLGRAIGRTILLHLKAHNRHARR